MQEWWEYAIDYTIQTPELRFSSDYQRPEAYTKYPCYSQAMVDKVDEICSKYGLHLLGKSTFITNGVGMEANGLSGVLSDEAVPRCFYGHLHGASHGLAQEGVWDGIEFKLVAADKLNFKPHLVLP